MKKYNRKTFFENKKCLEDLKQFRQMVDAYSKNRELSRFELNELRRENWKQYEEYNMRKPVINEDDLKNLCKQINEKLPLIRQIIIDSEIDTSITYSSSLSSGVVDKRRLHLLENIFNLGTKGIPYDFIVDNIDRSIGVYKNDQKASIIRTFNPIFWIKELLDFIVGIPFYFLKKSGFNSSLEETFLARIIKLIVYLVSLISGAWFIADKFLGT